MSDHSSYSIHAPASARVADKVALRKLPYAVNLGGPDFSVPTGHIVFEGGTTAAVAAGLPIATFNVSMPNAGGAAPGSDPYAPLYATAVRAAHRLDWKVPGLPCGKFAVALYFARPPPEEKGRHVYDIFLEEQRVEAGFDPSLVPRGGGGGRGTVRKFTGVRVFDNTLAVSVRHISGHLDKSVHLSALSIARAGSAGEPAPPPNEAQLRPNPSSGTEAGLRKCILKRDGAHVPSPDAGPQQSTVRYLVVTVLGGLNQQRKGIVNAVVAARVLNATLVAPAFQHEDGHWDGKGDMGSVYDVEHFIAVLKDQVEIVRGPSQTAGAAQHCCTGDSLCGPAHMEITDTMQQSRWKQG